MEGARTGDKDRESDHQTVPDRIGEYTGDGDAMTGKLGIKQATRGEVKDEYSKNRRGWGQPDSN